MRANSRDTCSGGRGVIQSETAITVSGNAVVVAYNDSRGQNCPGQAPGYQVIGWSYSLDGGQTFTDGGPFPIPNRTNFNDGDAWLATGPDGTIYLSGLWQFTSSIAVIRGTVTDKGIDWAGPTVISGAGSYDKEAMTVDPDTGTIYLSYTRLGQGIFMYRSTDGALSFQGPVQVSPQTAHMDQGSVPAVGPNGEVYVAWGGYPTASVISFAKSLDGGQTFSQPQTIGRVSQFSVTGTERSPVFPHIAVDRTGGPNSGNIYVSWQSSHLSGHGDALMTRSTDGGDTWDDPIIINDDNGPGIKWFPTISVDDNGNLNAFFYDRRENPGTTTTNLFYAQSTDGGLSFGQNVKVTEVSSNWRIIGDGFSITWGDYINCISDGTDTLVAYADGRDGDPDAYFVRVSPATGGKP